MGESATFLVFLAETCISHSRTTVGAALSSAKRTSGRRRRPEGPGGSAPRPEGSPGCSSRPPPNRPPPPARGPGGAGCPNLLQRPGSRRSVREETLVFRASSRGRSRPGAPLQQIWTSPHLKTVPGAPPAPLRVSPSAWCHRWRRGTPAQRFRGSAGGPPNCEGYSEVVLKAWGVKVVVTVCSGGSSSSEGLLRRRPSASPGCDARGR